MKMIHNNLNKTQQNAKSTPSQLENFAENPAKGEKQKTRNSNQLESYEVEEICGHCQDKQARILC